MLSMLPLLPLVAAADAPQPIGVGADAPQGVSPRAAGKVELDLEGAPFLEPDEPVAQARVEEAVPVVEAQSAPKKSKKKLIIILGAALLLVVGAALYFFVFSTSKEKPAGPNVVVVHGPDWGQGEVSQHMIDFESFWVELTDSEGEARFLVCKFVVPTNSQANVLEFRTKMTIIRDAVFYYLKNKPYSFLSDNSKQPEIKKDLVGIINDYLVSEKIGEVLLDTYIIR